MIVPPCINKYYILDLQPANSFVGHAVAEGHTVFLVSWRNAGPEQGTLTWDDYLDAGVLRAIDVALEITGADKANTLGFCVGGTLLASALAIWAARGEQTAASMTLLTTLLDFSDTGEIGLLVTRRMVAAAGGGDRQGRRAQGQRAGAGVRLAAGQRPDLALRRQGLPARARPRPPFDLLYWNSDDTNLPGPMFCWYVRNTYLENKLREPGATVQRGVPVDLGSIDVPSFLYASKEDHIVPWKAAYASTQLLSGDVDIRARRQRPHRRCDQPAGEEEAQLLGQHERRSAATPTPTGWLDAAEKVPGSWWPTWYAWLAPQRQAGRRAARAGQRQVHRRSRRPQAAT